MMGNNGLGLPRQKSIVAAKSPMEDFLFILVISLAVGISFFANKKLADRFALAEKTPDANSIPYAEYARLVVCQLPGNTTRVSFAGRSFESVKELEEFADRCGLNLPDKKVLLKIEHTRTVGEHEDVKHVFLSRGITVLTEWENRK